MNEEEYKKFLLKIHNLTLQKDDAEDVVALYWLLELIQDLIEKELYAS